MTFSHFQRHGCGHRRADACAVLTRFCVEIITVRVLTGAAGQLLLLTPSEADACSNRPSTVCLHYNLSAIKRASVRRFPCSHALDHKSSQSLFESMNKITVRSGHYYSLRCTSFDYSLLRDIVLPTQSRAPALVGWWLLHLLSCDY